MWMATEPVTIPRPRKVPDSLQPTGKYLASQQPLQGSPASTIAKDGSQRGLPNPRPNQAIAVSHLTLRQEMTSWPQGLVRRGKKEVPSQAVR